MKKYRFANLKSRVESVGTLEVYWEVNYSSMSNDYTPDEVSAKKLFKIWASLVKQKYSSGLIDISWFVKLKNNCGSGFEFMPFQYYPPETEYVVKDYFHFWTQPIDCETGKLVDWLSLPVKDMFWNEKRADKGGFIQQATGWKPSILQPYVYLPSLESGLN